ncbi:hypothetical protein ABPG74_002712 [Tetrahymena malaccensis]
MKGNKNKKVQVQEQQQTISILQINLQNAIDLFEEEKKIENFIDQKLNEANKNSEHLKVLKLYLENEMALNIQYFKKLPDICLLENLQIKGFYTAEKQVKQFFQFIERQTQLKNLYIDVQCPYNEKKQFEAEFQNFCQRIGKFQKLEYLYLQIMSIESTNQLKELSKSLKSLGSLKSLTLFFGQVGSEIVELDSLAGYLETTKTLKTLQIKFEEPSTFPLKEAQQLFQAIGSNKSIEDLTLSFAGCTEFKKNLFQDLSNMINNKKNLKKFSINFDSLSHIKADEYTKVLKSIENMKALTSLEVNLNQNKTNIDQLTNLIKQQTQLIHLELNLCDIKINGQFQKINDALKSFTKLKSLVLDLSNNKLFTKTFQGLFDFLPKLDLDHLSLDLSNEEGNYKEKFFFQIAKYIGQCSSLKSLKFLLQYYDAEDDFYSQLIKELSKLQDLSTFIVSDALGEHLDNSVYKMFKSLVFFEMKY